MPDVAGTTYSPAELATLDNEFFCLSDDGAMIMHAPVDGGTDGSTYPRTELREMVDPDSSSVGWVISGTHTMSATTTVTQEPSMLRQFAKLAWLKEQGRLSLGPIEACPEG